MPRGRSGKALRRIHACRDQPVEVSTLFGKASMSVTTFHSHFKVITRITPRMASYESSSRFSREFKCVFARP